MILPTFVSIAFAFLLGVANGQVLRNITIDDTDPAITYTGSWGNGRGDSDSYGDSHRWANESGAYATFVFTGVAVYYLMPIFEGYPGGVSTLLTLDSRQAQLVNLTRVGSEPTVSAVRWSASGLTSGTHTVVISLGVSARGELANWGEVDAFIYTLEDSSSASFNAPNPTSIQSPASTNAPKPKAPKAQALTSLGDCAPCGKSKCSFSPEGSPISDTYSLVVGKPVSNCGARNNETVTSLYTTEMEVSETWSVDASIGVSYVGLSVGWSRATSVRASQQVSMSIPPGKMAALIASVNYKKTSGNMYIDSAVWSFSSIQPTGITGYSVEYADCGNLFNAFTLSSSNCTSNSAAYTNRYSPLFMGLMGITVLWMI